MSMNIRLQFMEKFEEQGGISFLLIYYTDEGMSYIICGTRQIQKFWDRAKERRTEKVFGLKNWNPEFVYGIEKMIVLSLIWIVYKKTLDRQGLTD